MRIYLDMCCLKRPFDDKSQPRIRLESQAVLEVLAAESPSLECIRSRALWLENMQNPVVVRAARVARWLAAAALVQPELGALQARTEELMKLGLGNFDSLHVATAELVAADIFATCDDRLVRLVRRSSDLIRIRVGGILDVAAEVLS
jgi:predicted nucleic acid-binding protein